VSGEGEFSVTIACPGFTETVRGRTPEEVFRGVAKALSQHFPVYELVSGLVFRADYDQLLAELRGLVTFFSEGGFLLNLGPEVSDYDTVLTCLVAAHAGQRLGLCERESLSITETHRVVQASRLPYSRKTVSNRLGDLSKMNLARRLDRGEYAVTEQGIRHFLVQSLPAIKGGGGQREP